jgi:hypothetical protein
MKANAKTRETKQIILWLNTVKVDVFSFKIVQNCRGKSLKAEKQSTLTDQRYLPNEILKN